MLSGSKLSAARDLTNGRPQVVVQEGGARESVQHGVIIAVAAAAVLLIMIMMSGLHTQVPGRYGGMAVGRSAAPRQYVVLWCARLAVRRALLVVNVYKVVSTGLFSDAAMRRCGDEAVRWLDISAVSVQVRDVSTVQ